MSDTNFGDTGAAFEHVCCKKTAYRHNKSATDFRCAWYGYALALKVYCLINFACKGVLLVVTARRMYMPCGRAETSISVCTTCITHCPLRLYIFTCASSSVVWICRIALTGLGEIAKPSLRDIETSVPVTQSSFDETYMLRGAFIWVRSQNGGLIARCTLAPRSIVKGGRIVMDCPEYIIPVLSAEIVLFCAVMEPLL